MRAARPGRAPAGRASRAIVGIGIDLIEVERMETEITRDAEGLRAQTFTPGEVAHCEGQPHPAAHYAACFAAKEAVLKALAVGVADGASLREVEIESGRRGCPRVILHGKARKAAARLRVHRVILSLSHTRGLAAACVVLES